MAAESTATTKKSKSKPKKVTPPARTSAKTSAKPRASASGRSLRREVSGLVLLSLALAILLALVSFNPADIGAAGAPDNLIGPAGVWIGDALLAIFGVGSFFLNVMLWYLGFAMLIGRTVDSKASEIGGQLIFVVAGTVLSHLILYDYIIFGHLPGGFLGEFCGEISRGLFGTVGTYIIAVSTLLLSLMLATDMSLAVLVRRIVGRFHRMMAYARHQMAVRREYKERFEEERRKLLDEEGAPTLEERARREAELSVAPLTVDGYEFEDRFEEDVDRKLTSRLSRLFGSRIRATRAAEAGSAPAPDVAEGKASAKKSRKAPKDKIDDDWEIGALLNTEDEIDTSNASSEIDDDAPVSATTDEAIEVSDTSIIDMKAEREPIINTRGPDVDFGPQIVESDAARRSKERKEALADDGDGLLFKPQKRGAYELPPLSFLNYDNNDEVFVDSDMLREMAAQIEKTLLDFKVDGTIVEICPGPVITMFEFSPAPGVKISRIAGLSDDLAMALAALSVRIVAPIPGKGVVGIEVPNPTREMVFLKEIIADEAFMDNKKMTLPLALGKDTEGGPVIADLAKMPHLLVAGATGAGKSVAVNTMICSLLYKHTPDDVRLIMVDPKMLEFSIYTDIPHLLLPVVTDPKQATVALNWTVQEMERRYQALADMGVRDLSGYNKKVAVYTKQAEIDQIEGREETEALKALGIDHKGNPEHRKLPFIIVIIDEFADLMMTASKDVETAVARLAQKARAAGIHLILATQRPSTDVITGLIKANFPTRLALRVTSKTDSRVILDSNGAENLLGNGDMLFVPPGSSNLTRAHGAYVSEKEIDQVVAFLRKQGTPQYDDSILAEDDDEDSSVFDDVDKDEHYEEAVRIVVETNQASISMLQRKLRVGYNRAARMVDIMEMEGIVGASDSCKPREVLVDISPY